MAQLTASGPDQFDPATFTVVEPRRFEDLEVGDIFRAPSPTLTDAHATAFQAVSADNHPVHYNIEYARSHGHSAPVVHGLQVLAFTAPGATLFPQYIGDVFIAFTTQDTSARLQQSARRARLTRDRNRAAGGDVLHNMRPSVLAATRRIREHGREPLPRRAGAASASDRALRVRASLALPLIRLAHDGYQPGGAYWHCPL